MMFFSDDMQADTIDAFKTTSPFLNFIDDPII